MSKLTPAEQRLFPDRDPDVYAEWQQRLYVRSRLEAVRRKRQLRQATLAEAMKISERQLRRVETRTTRNPGDRLAPSIAVLARAALVLDVRLDSLVEAEDIWLPVDETPPRFDELRQWRPQSRTTPTPPLP